MINLTELNKYIREFDKFYCETRKKFIQDILNNIRVRARDSEVSKVEINLLCDFSKAVIN